MRIGTKILLLMLLITIGTSALISWMVTLQVTKFETDRANDQISTAIKQYQRKLDSDYNSDKGLVQAVFGDPLLRDTLRQADDPSNTTARQQLMLQVFPKDIPRELENLQLKPDFNVLVNAAAEVIGVSAEEEYRKVLEKNASHWPIDSVLDSKSQPVLMYVSAENGLFLVMGIPLHADVDQPATHAYFQGYRIDNDWVRRLLPDDAASTATAAHLSAWFIADNRIIASGSSDPSGTRSTATNWNTPMRSSPIDSNSNRVEFVLDGEQFIGQSSSLISDSPNAGRLILASSLSQALIPLHQLQRSILWITLVACFLAIVACRGIALMISRPIGELAAGTKRIASGHFDLPVQIVRNDELGELADSFNKMSDGLKQRDGLLVERAKSDRDLATARKIQMDVLPRELPSCPGYDLTALSLPAEQTGGDIYDLVSLRRGSADAARIAPVAILLADATGHGIAAALSVTQVRSMLRIGVRLDAPIDPLFAQINNQLCQDLSSERFVTAFWGILDPQNHRMTYQSAGQAPLLHFSAKERKFNWLDSSMPPLGIMPDIEPANAAAINMEPGDLFVLLTDGFYEYLNAEGALFGKDRIAEIILQHHLLPSSPLLEKLLAGTREFGQEHPQMDDMTAIIIRRLDMVI